VTADLDLDVYLARIGGSCFEQATLLAEHLGIDLPEVERLRIPSEPDWA
jgi:hypothetical protein